MPPCCAICLQITPWTLSRMICVLKERPHIRTLLGEEAEAETEAFQFHILSSPLKLEFMQRWIHEEEEEVELK